MVRLINLKDNLNKVAKLIYYTDPYIYPFWFNNKINDAVKVLKRLIKTKNNVFYYKNIYGLFIDKKILGIVVSFNNTTDLSYDFKKELNTNKSKTTIKNYILELNKYQKPNETYISNICIDQKYRGQGFGNLLLKSFIKKSKNKNYSLHVLADNKAAKHLYQKFNFKRTKTEKGFAGFNNKTVKMHEMKIKI